MIWKSHKLVSAAIAYACNLPMEGIIAVALGSVLPDAVEFLFKFKHRGLSHFWGIYALLYLVAMIMPVPQYYFLHVIFIKWTLIGCLLHLFEDSMSKGGMRRRFHIRKD